MRDLTSALKAASDPGRARILKMLEGGELCVCQIQSVLGLAPSTVSRHLAVLRSAGLVVDRQDGRWAYYALARERGEAAGAVLDLLRGRLDRDPRIQDDRRRLKTARSLAPDAACEAEPARASRHGVRPPAPRSRSGSRR